MQIDAAVRMARSLMDRHGLRDWALVLDRAKTRAGVCRYDRRQIGLSRPLTQLHTEAEVRDTVLHEIAHALVGPEHGHDVVWRARALAIGGSGSRCISSTSGAVPGRWQGICPAGHVSTRHRRPQRPVSCGRCSSRFDPGLLLRWRCDGREVPMHPRYLAELAALHGEQLRRHGSTGLDHGAGHGLDYPSVGRRPATRWTAAHRRGARRTGDGNSG